MKNVFVKRFSLKLSISLYELINFIKRISVIDNTKNSIHLQIN